MRKLFIFAFFFMHILWALSLLGFQGTDEPVRIPGLVWTGLIAGIVGLHTTDRSPIELGCIGISMIGSIWLAIQIATLITIFAANYFGIVVPIEVSQKLTEWWERIGKGAL